MGHTVLAAQSGEQALELIEQGPLPDLMITDHAMPKMTGVELAKEITRRYGLPIILATGYAELSTGADGGLPRLSKPYRQEALAEAIANVMRASR